MYQWKSLDVLVLKPKEVGIPLKHAQRTKSHINLDHVIILVTTNFMSTFKNYHKEWKWHKRKARIIIKLQVKTIIIIQQKNLGTKEQNNWLDGKLAQLINLLIIQIIIIQGADDIYSDYVVIVWSHVHTHHHCQPWDTLVILIILSISRS